MEIYIVKFILIFISILIISTLTAYLLVVKIGGTIINLQYRNISRKLNRVAMAWDCKVETKYLDCPKISGIHNGFQIILTFYDFIGICQKNLPKTLLQIKTSISKNVSLIILKKVKNKNAYPIYMLKEKNFIKTGNIELDKYYSFISDNENESKKILKIIEKILFNKRYFFDNYEILQINKNIVKYEMDKIQINENYLTEKLSFIENVVKKLEQEN